MQHYRRLIPTLLWIVVSLWCLSKYLPLNSISTYSLPVFRVNDSPVFWIWRNTFVRTANFIPETWRLPLAAAFVVGFILVSTFTYPQTVDNNIRNRGISIAGLVVFYIILYITSENPRKIVWRTVLAGLLCQYLLALFVLRTNIGYEIFSFVSLLAR